MTRNQFLLTKLAEECAEVSQRALKQIQFGATQIQKGNEVKDGTAPPDKEVGLTNAQRLSNELLDLAFICDLLEAEGQLVRFTDEEIETARERKTDRLNKYLEFSRSLGEIDGDWKI